MALNTRFKWLALCIAGLLVFMPFAHSDAADEINSCAVSNMRTYVRPDADGPPTEVSVGIFMVDLVRVSDPDQTLTGDFAVAVTWTDPRLAHLEGCRIPLDEIWSPGLGFFNSGKMERSRPRQVSVGPGGSLRYAQRYYGTMASYHNLNDFPFDDQIFRISLVPIEWTDQDIELVVDETVTGRRELLNISDWEIEGIQGVISRQSAPARNAYAPSYDFLITAHRMTGFYLWKVILPLCLIVAMSWCVFWISPELFGPQIGLSATSMLTLIAFIFATTNMVPALGYFTLLDLFIGGSTILVFLALLESLAVTYLVSKDKTGLARSIDLKSRAFYPLAFFLLIIVLFII